MDKFVVDLSDWIKSIIRDVVNEILLEKDNDDGLPEMMNRKDCIRFLKVDGTVFDKYRKLPNFPKEQEGTKWKKRSHPTWVRGLKFTVVICLRELQCRTPHGCVD